MAMAMRMYSNGGPEVLVREEYEPGRPGEGEILIRHTAIGLNFLDVYYRSGLYPPPAGLPLIIGHEAAGVVVETGPGLEWPRPGDRVAYVSSIGAYCTERVIAADKVVPIPAGVSDEQVAASLLKGMTVEFLLRRTFPVGPAHTILYHAAAGGVGLLFGQWAKHLGATLIGTVGCDAKARMALANGYDHVISYGTADVVGEVDDLTKGGGCDVVYDSVGRDTFASSLNCLKTRGLLVNFGQSSGTIPPLEMPTLANKSLYVTRPVLFHYIDSREELHSSADLVFNLLERGVVRAEVNQRYHLDEAAKAHADLEARRTSGATVLIPE